MFRVTLLALTMPPSPMLYRDFETKPEAMRWKAWASCLPCHARLTREAFASVAQFQQQFKEQ